MLRCSKPEDSVNLVLLLGSRIEHALMDFQSMRSIGRDFVSKSTRFYRVYHLA